MYLQNDWIDLLREFNDADVKYLGIGAAAMAVHGEIRGTDDFDVWVDRSEENARKVRRALGAFGADVSELSVEELQSEDLIYQIGVKPLRIDVLTGIDGIAFHEAWPNRVLANDGPVPFPVISRADLIRNKRAAGRRRDLADIEALEAIERTQDNAKQTPRRPPPRSGGRGR